MSYTEERTAFVVGLAAGAARERRRIRRLIAPHLRTVVGWLEHESPCPCLICGALDDIDAATRAPKKSRTK